jgi:hypothetical protein
VPGGRRGCGDGVVDWLITDRGRVGGEAVVVAVVVVVVGGEIGIVVGDGAMLPAERRLLSM